MGYSQSFLKEFMIKVKEDRLYSLFFSSDNDYQKSRSLIELKRSTWRFIMKFYQDKSYGHRAFKKLPMGDDIKIYKLTANLIKAVNNGDIKKGMEILREFIFDKDRLRLNISSLKKGKINYRMRGRDDYNLYKKEDMFHIPFDLLKVVPSYRYSISGFPCLYLGASLYSCWEETRRPELEKVNFSAFMNIRQMKFIDVLCPNNIDSTDNLVRFIIFALCTSFVSTNNDDNKFKFQYVIPELLLSLLVSERNNGNVAVKGVDGIKYLSTRYFRDAEMFGVEPVFYNYVIPIRQYKDEGHCPKLINTFRVTDAKANFDHVLRRNKYNVPRTRINNYSSSLFAVLEKNLWSKKDFGKIKS